MTAVHPRGQAALCAMVVIAAIWAVVSPVFVLLPIFENVATEGVVKNTSASEAGKLGEALAVLVSAAALGVVAFISSRMLLSGRQPAQFAMMGAAAGVFVLTILTGESVGPLLIGPAVLLMFPSLWLVPRGSSSDRSAGG